MNVVVATLNAKYIHMSLALRYLKAFCQPAFDVRIAEYTIKDPVYHIVSDLYRLRPDVVGFSCYIWNIEETISVVSMLKKVMPGVVIVLGGPEVSYDTEYWMQRVPEADFVVMGEGEETFYHLLEELRGGGAFSTVWGAAYRKNGRPVLNPPRPKLDLNRLPSPHRFAEDVPHLPNRIVYFETSRGCPFSCQFCLSSVESGVRYFDLDRVKADLLYLIKSGARQIKFVDRTFNLRRDYALDIFRFLAEHHGGCVFQFEITADIMRPEVLDFLTENAPPGLFRFEIGVQSTNDRTNEAVGRKQHFAKLARTVTRLKESGRVTQHLDLIAGLPEEDYERFRQTFNDVFALRPEELQLGFLKMLRGTGLRRDAERWGYVYMDRAPYEILRNDVLSFDDLLRIKRVEDILEKYWNAHRADYTIEYLVRWEFPSPWDFFQEFGDYWEERGWPRTGHQLEDLFVRLREFLESRNIRRPDVAVGLMKLDYLLQHRHRPRAFWWDDAPDKRLLARWFGALSGSAAVREALALSRADAAEWPKRAVATVVPFGAELLRELETLPPSARASTWADAGSGRTAAKGGDKAEAGFVGAKSARVEAAEAGSFSFDGVGAEVSSGPSLLVVFYPIDGSGARHAVVPLDAATGEIRPEEARFAAR